MTPGHSNGLERGDTQRFSDQNFLPCFPFLPLDPAGIRPRLCAPAGMCGGGGAVYICFIRQAIFVNCSGSYVCYGPCLMTSLLEYSGFYIKIFSSSFSFTFQRFNCHRFPLFFNINSIFFPKDDCRVKWPRGHPWSTLVRSLFPHRRTARPLRPNRCGTLLQSKGTVPRNGQCPNKRRPVMRQNGTYHSQEAQGSMCNCHTVGAPMEAVCCQISPSPPTGLK